MEKPMKILNIAAMLIFIIFIFLFATVSCGKIDDPERRTCSDNQVGSSVLQVAKQVVEIFNAQDGKKLASLVHPEKGVRFSPYAFVDTENDVVFSDIQIERFWADERIYTWGVADGTGNPINMTPSQYCREYIMDRDFLNSFSININSDRAFGNTNNNAAMIYPYGTRVEFYIESAMQNGTPELDWAALRLVFEKSKNSWFLIAVIHDEWTT